MGKTLNPSLLPPVWFLGLEGKQKQVLYKLFFFWAASFCRSYYIKKTHMKDLQLIFARWFSNHKISVSVQDQGTPKLLHPQKKKNIFFIKCKIQCVEETHDHCAWMRSIAKCFADLWILKRCHINKIHLPANSTSTVNNMISTV